MTGHPYYLTDLKHAEIGNQFIEMLEKLVTSSGGNFNDGILVQIKMLACCLAIADSANPGSSTTFEEQAIILLRAQYAAHFKHLNPSQVN